MNDTKYIKSLDLFYRKLYDNIFINQCVVRIFKSQNVDHFIKLLGIRKEIESILYEPDSALNIEIIQSSMSFPERQKNRDSLNSKVLEDIRTLFYEHLYIATGLDKFELWLLDHLYEDKVDGIIEVLNKNTHFFKELIDNYNIFDNFSFLSMTVDIDFERFFKIYLESYHGKNGEYLSNEKIRKEARLICYSPQKNVDTYDSDIYLAIKSRNCFQRYLGSNISVFFDNDNSIVINEKRSENSLYLKFPINEMPNNIDAAVEYFKASLFELLMRNQRAEEIIDSEFINSDFRKSYKNNMCLMKVWGSMNRYICGLWCWDLVNTKKYDDRKYTKSDASDQINEKIQSSYRELSQKIPPKYSEDKFSKYYDSVAAIISFKNKDGKTLNKFVTGSEKTILGQRER